jgi:hypothetical protein
MGSDCGLTWPRLMPPHQPLGPRIQACSDARRQVETLGHALDAFGLLELPRRGGTRTLPRITAKTELFVESLGLHAEVLIPGLPKFVLVLPDEPCY